MRLGIMITEKCNLECNHCMFACTAEGKDMTERVMYAINRFIENNDIYSINVYGGEPFLNMNLFNTFIRILGDKHKNHSFYISSNGTFMSNDKWRDKVYDFLLEFRENEEECSGLRISNSEYHASSRTEEQDKGIELLKYYTKEYYNFYYATEHYDEDTDEYTTEDNPFFYKSDNSLVHIEDQDFRMGANPSGRANEWCVTNDRGCYCVMTTDEFDEDYINSELHINVKPDGGISLCCTCDGCVVANILEPNFSKELIIKRIKALRKHFRKVHNVDSDTRMHELCSICKMYQFNYKIDDYEATEIIEEGIELFGLV